MGEQAYVPGFDYDVFVSYAHQINIPQFGRIRWVSDLKEDLTSVLASTLPSVPEIWLSEDEKTRKRSGNWWTDINTALKSSAILITINGPAWDGSPNCKNEKDVFEEEEEDPRTNSSARRIIEVVHKLKDGKSPSNLITSDPVWFCPTPQDNPLGTTFGRGNPGYIAGIEELGRRVAGVLSEMRDSAPAITLNPSYANPQFLLPATAIADLHAKLKRVISKQYRLVDDLVPAPSVSVHVLGQHNTADTLVLFDRARQKHGNISIVILDPDLSKNDPSARRYQQFEREGLEVYVGANKTNDELVSDVISRISRIFPRKSRQTNLYVICSSTDRNTARFKRLEEKLRDYDQDKWPGNKVIFHEGAQNMKQKNFFSRCDGAFLVWQGGDSSWFRPQYLEELQNGQSVRKPTKPIAANGVCLLKPPALEQERKEEVLAELANQWTPPNYYFINDLAAEATETELWASVEQFLAPLRDQR